MRPRPVHGARAEFAPALSLAAAWSCGPWAGAAYGLAAGFLRRAGRADAVGRALALAVFLLSLRALLRGAGRALAVYVCSRCGPWPWSARSALPHGARSAGKPSRISRRRGLKLATGLLFAPPVLAYRKPDGGKGGADMADEPFRRRRTLAAGAILLAVLCVYAALLIRMQVTDAAAHRAEAEKRVTRTLTLSAPRPNIYDRNGTPSSSTVRATPFRSTARAVPGRGVRAGRMQACVHTGRDGRRAGRHAA